MEKGIRNFMALSASLSLVALTGCSGIMGGEGEEGNNEEAAGNVEDVPALSEIDDQMWTSMEEAGNVTLTADLSAVAGEEPQAVEMFEQMGGGDLSDIRIYGALDGTASAMSLSEDDLMRSFGEEGTFLSTDAIFNIISGQSMGLSSEEQQMFDDLKEEFAGSWIDYSNEMQAGDGSENFNVGVLFDELRDSWENGDDAEGTAVERGQISDEGTHEVREENDVWIYTGQEEGQELVLQANHDAPMIASVSDEGATMHFSDWGETELPEQPDESQLMTEQDIQERMSGSAGSGSTSGDSGSSDLDMEPTTPETNSNSGSNSDRVEVPGVGTVDCSGPVPGDPGFTDPNGNYTDAEIQAFQDACADSGSSSDSASNSGSDSSYSGSDVVNIPDVGTFNCEGPKPGDPGFTDPNGNYTDAEIQQIQDACNS
ncbi:MAG: hypothetical protein HLX51_13550 [Micrococcaceae bacterium]|nr:hypothetical protein [Micrococcaceae bacterium]